MRFGMILSEEFVALHDPVGEVFTLEPRDLRMLERLRFTLGRIYWRMDNSPPDRKRRFEYNRKEPAVAVRSPELFVELDQEVDVFNQTVNGLVTVNQLLVDLFTEAFGLAQSGSGGNIQASKVGEEE